MSTPIENRFRQAFPDAIFEVRKPDDQDDSKYDIEVTNGTLDERDVAHFEVACHSAGIDVIIEDRTPSAST